MIKLLQEVKIMNTIYVAHRGCKINGGVENTEQAFLGGIKAGAQALECDVRVTGDLVYIISHDPTLERLTTESNTTYTMDVNQVRYDEIKDIELTQTYNNKTYHGKIMLFSRYLELCRDYDMIPIIELKWTNGIYSDNNDETNYNYSCLDKLVALIKEYKLFDTAYVMTSMRGCLSYLRQKYPTLKLQWLCWDNIEPYIDWCIINNISLDVEHHSCSKEIVDRMHSHDLIVNIWTMNDETLLNKYLEMKVDMITSDWIIKREKQN